ncbi:hypothetical protein HF086_005800 [Spodoptera exigua]|uniref:Tc1-like transposase DDE domain-containing protein n=1 Tax=Spodoptera exigua TaxID=7107 RepID=A0A922M7E7_SPOEX|nr:hypothetical protein HF086_005800 [Spodoptera exigua]
MNKTIRSSGRAVIYHVYLRCLAESQAGQVLSAIESVYQRTADMTGKSVNTIRKIVEEGEKNNGIFSTPGKHRKGRPRKDLDNFDLCAIRQKVHFFYTVKKQWTNKNEDYHSEMNKTNFTKWVTEKLNPNLSEPSIIVMDNAPYNSVVLNKAPTSASKVAEIKIWLLQNNIPFNESLRKPQLLMLVKRHKPDPIYEIDHILGDNGHTVVRLPPYHCDLNPIELIWGIAKHKIASVNVGSIDIKRWLLNRPFLTLLLKTGRIHAKHVMKIEKEYYDRGAIMYEQMERLVINLRDDSSSDLSELEYSTDSECAGSSSQNVSFSGIEYLDESVFDSSDRIVFVFY